MESLFLLTIFSSVIVSFNFFYYLVRREIKTENSLFTAIEILTVVIIPIAFLTFADIGKENECCGDSAVFSPKHRIGIYAAILFYTIAYIAAIKKRILFPPVMELLINISLIIGVVINVLLCVHLNKTDLGGLFWMMGNVPIIMLLVLKLIQRQQLIQNHISENKLSVNNAFGRIALNILQLNPLIKYPVLLLLVLPVTLLLSLILLIFGQKPDSLIRAFTDTYKHGFSQLDYMCDNVDCGGHFLCSVGAKGHKRIVKPIRYGERNGNKIICTRQLLVSNAFEDLLQEKFPKSHRSIRSHYNKVGSFIHKYYHFFNIKWVSDIVYILMKPLEWIFLLVLYTFDECPENRIAKQYLSAKDRKSINMVLK